MIRRNVPRVDQPSQWLLVSQVEHARVSAVLGAAWGGGRVADVVCPASSNNAHLLEVRNELLVAVLHHDDGWASWEASPSLDMDEGRPYSFMELPRRSALSLWRDSVLRTRQVGALAGWVVAGHFEQLLHDSHDAYCEMSENWLAEIRNWRETWIDSWRSINRPVHRQELANECLEWLRVFDWLSLWLCCYCPARDDDPSCNATTLSEGILADSPVTFTPSASKSMGDPSVVHVAPWPFAQDIVDIDVLGFAVPAKSYTSPAELAKSRSPTRLRWRLSP